MRTRRADWPAFVFTCCRRTGFADAAGTAAVDAAEEIIIEAMGAAIMRADAGLVAGMALGVVLQTPGKSPMAALTGRWRCWRCAEKSRRWR
ncbi:MAG: hypothetical protein R3C40_07290 [Parvularculaceae bacterium]